ncbi:MAG: hypothetical protein ACRDZ2_16180, partial [Ilumatobacteraceae bacterium]
AVNRIALQPSGPGVVAATTIGLFQRSSAPGADVDWTRVAEPPFDTLEAQCTDVLWTAADGPRPERLWVWVHSGPRVGLWVRAAGADRFTPIPTPGSQPQRAVLAASNPPDQVWVLNDRPGGTALLYRVAAAAAAVPVATRVSGVPNVLGGQGFYDIAMAVHPANPDRIVLGGSTFDAVAPDLTDLESDGAVVWADVATNGAGTLTFGHPNPPEMVGVGVHADVHDVRFANGGGRLWAACDGGVYRSDDPTGQVAFFPCNTGLSIIESNYVATHPRCEGFLSTGLQDNGVITRRSNGVWRNAGLGDGGGIVLDPMRQDRWLRQHFRGLWSSSDDSVKATAMLKRGATFAKKEHEDSAFYCAAAAIGHRRGSPAPAEPNVGQIIVGTTRVWYTEDFGTTWVTLPTGTDPLPADLDLDRFGQQITACRWQSPDVAWVMGEGRIQRYFRDAGSDAGGGPGTWHRQLIIEHGVKNKKDETSAEGPIREARWTDLAVNLEPDDADPDALAQARGAKGAVYLGTIGHPTKAAVDTLWWFDGNETWRPTGLRNDPNGVPAPVTAITCDPAHPEEVWVGTTVGVWRGLRTIPASGPPTWAWSSRVNGLPEAAVEDLSIFSDGGLRLLRAAISSRGVWELRLDQAELEDVTYLRAHDDDLRYRATATLTKRHGSGDRSWHASPDVRPRVASASKPAPASLEWTRSFFDLDNEGLRRFQAALRRSTGDQRVRPTGEWDDYFNEVLRSLGAPTLPSPPATDTVTVCIDDDFWDAHMTGVNATSDAWGAGPPTEEDLYELSAKLEEGDVKRTSCQLPKANCKVDVVVHHRGLDPRPGADVRVVLLRWFDPRSKNAARWNNASTWFSGNVPWTVAVNQVLNSSGGTTSATFGGGWQFVGTAATRRKTLAGQTLDATRSGVVTFDLDLSGRKRDSVVLLAAVVRAGTTAADDIALAPASLQDLALTNKTVAVRSVQVVR